MPRHRLLTWRTLALAQILVTCTSGCARCAPGSAPTGSGTGRAIWIATVGPGGRSAGELDEVGRRVLAAVAQQNASTAAGSVATHDGVRVVIDGPDGIDPLAYAAVLSVATSERVRLERYVTPSAARHFLVADVDRGLLEAQELSVDDVATAIAAAPAPPANVAALGAIPVAEGSDGPLALSQAAQLRDEPRAFGSWTSLVRVRAPDVASVAHVLHGVEQALRTRDPALAVRALPRDRTSMVATVDEARARQRGVDPAEVARAARRMLAWHRVVDGVSPIVIRTQPPESAQLDTLSIDGADGLTLGLREVASLAEQTFALPIVRDAAGGAFGFALTAGNDSVLESIRTDVVLLPGTTIEVVARSAMSPAEQALIALCTSSDAAEDLAEQPALPTVPASP